MGTFKKKRINITIIFILKNIYNAASIINITFEKIYITSSIGNKKLLCSSEMGNQDHVISSINLTGLNDFCGYYIQLSYNIYGHFVYYAISAFMVNACVEFMRKVDNTQW